MNLQEHPELPGHVSVPEHVLWQEVDGRVVLLDVDGAQYHALDDVGSRMWTALQDEVDVAAAYETLREVYDVAPDTLSRDLADFIAALVETGLLREAPADEA